MEDSNAEPKGDEPQVQLQPVAPRPHRLTIALGLLSPIVSVGAMAIAVASVLVSMRLSQRSMQLTRDNARIAQQPYLTIRQPRLDVGLFTTVADKSVKQANFSTSFELVNLGNTPARITSFDMKLMVHEPMMLIFPDAGVTAVSRPLFAPVVIGPKESISEEMSTGIYYRDSTGIGSSTFGADGSHPPVFVAALNYVDVFGEAHELVWCWWLGELNRPNDCGDRLVKTSTGYDIRGAGARKAVEQAAPSIRGTSTEDGTAIVAFPR